jgi:hypothetical protein
MTERSKTPPVVVLEDMIAGVYKAQVVYVAARLGIADLLRDSPRSAADLARATGAHAASLDRVLKVLAASGILAEEGEHLYSLTAAGRLLRSDVPGSMRDAAVKSGAPWSWRAWGSLLYTVRTGETAFDHAFGARFYDYLTTDPEADAVFGAFMGGFVRGMGAAVASKIDLSEARTLVDVGGGQGGLLASILKLQPHLRGILVDRPGVAAQARQRLAEAGVLDRCQIAAGDFFASVPRGGDVYILSMVLDDWQDAEARSILRNCRDAMEGRGRLLLIHKVIDPQGSLFGRVLDLYMMVLTGGRERSEAQYRTLLLEAGLAFRRVVSGASGLSIIEATATSNDD